ncbi:MULTISPECIES: RNA polymerase factor sigma-54 [Xanthomonas]|uniref:RNA polymerase sigma-54 factor n=1 Tax=Xanthomonas rydalmerensis TaxID=3046274 RepID=A0ABZ0JH74_9XANT|nr:MULTISPECIES: RNA polymerase factor sigma-54 [unclassified Xanthomonas]MBB5876405.1 RNA polymerase sigma-54 factor [Xanthomonas sp. 3498]WOS38945.1 RNA polymerase factor sigma-54 [Xanthomonas sp. DM-2023]WOS43126.1 RNA polymerase factor sigma-54 [Xanthomonas sp. DM-2023]WOS47307.1 RNA polymerase factor sigma-54 [Xanthomonas sp. DM-2023]WOS51488.1 RNA polymerase factor sigma-54 [Xanthomonas sp. DM-2023]
MKPTVSAQLGQQLHLTPQLLQSIRLLQLDGMQLELEIRRALETNPLLELEESEGVIEPVVKHEDAGLETAAFDELPESSMWDIPAAGWNDGEDDRMQRIAAGESSDPHLRVLQRLALELPALELEAAAFWLEHCDDAGYLDGALETLQQLASARLGLTVAQAEAVRQRLLHGDPAGLCACDLRECLQAQLSDLPGRVPGRHLAARILEGDLNLLASHDYALLGRQLDAETDDVREAVRLILSLQPRPGDSLQPQDAGHVLPDVVAWHADGTWRVALNPATTHRVTVNPMHERALAEAGDAAQPLREMLQEARWLTRGLSMRYETLLRTTRAIVERQSAFLVKGEEAMAPLTLKEVAEAIGMHESTISRITTGKYLQTPRGTFELKHFFAVRLEGAAVSGQAVRAMVRRLIESEPAGRPLADEAIAGLLSRQGVNVARRTVAKYREQLDIAPARERRRGSKPLLARVG